jgi:formylglycine-generating enzyme required for sulfatase activity
MARLMVAFTALAAVSFGQTSPDQQFKEAGVCARCHVISVVEWGISKHSKVGTGCVACHGTSLGHVADERNNVKPERIPHGTEVTRMCRQCHPSQKQDGCEKCHHMHALVNPTKAAVAPEVSSAPVAVAGKTASHLPSNPVLPGFEIQGSEVDQATGLARRVAIGGLGIPMALVPEGRFEMGSERFKSAQPVHTVHVVAYYLAQFELTQSEWTALMGSNPSFHQGSKYPNAAKMPVESISWKDAQSVIATLNSRIAGGGFRLPTEAEWEYAARLGGADPAPVIAADAPAVVTAAHANRFGLYGMSGNVWEWCSSLDRSYPYDANDGREDPAAAGARVLRGGSYADSKEWADPGARHAIRPEVRLKWNGIRLARSIP